MQIILPFGEKNIPVTVPDGTDVLAPAPAAALPDPAAALQHALAHPIGCAPLREIAAEKHAAGGRLACIVVSDNTRPVPYKGKDGLLLPLLQLLQDCGWQREEICILIACGTHAPMNRMEIEQMLGREPYEMGIRIENHNCRADDLVDVGVTARGTAAKINPLYAHADLKILTGLVESHFMAGASGGRKSVCPGIFGEQGTFVFHGPALMADENARDLQLEGNPVHEESLAVAKMAGADFIVNVTLDGQFRPTGIFCGALEQAHLAAVEKLKASVGIPFDGEYDLVITHAGFVGRNHYQAAKAAVEASYCVKPGGAVILAANNHDRNPLGSERYVHCCGMLRRFGAKGFLQAITAPGWTFLPDQWQVQMWARLFGKIRMEDLIYFAPQLTAADFEHLPGTDGSRYRPEGLMGNAAVAAVVENAVAAVLKKRGATEEDVRTGRFRIAYLAEGPYAVPMKA